MKINWYLISSGRLQEQPTLTGWPNVDLSRLGESWFDVEEASPEELRSFLAPLNLHPVMTNRCLDSANTPGVISYDRAVLLEFPATLNLSAMDPSYFTIILQAPVLVTIRTGAMPAIKDRKKELSSQRDDW